MPRFARKTEAKKQTCHSDIQRVLDRAIKIVDFTIIYGHRGERDQNDAYAKGNSKVLFPNSKHNQSPSVAVDVAPWPIDWENIKRFNYLAGVIMTCAHEEGVELTWGGDWGWDWGHFELKEV